MIIRHASDADVSAIIALLKKSLGESLMPKSEAFWRWKHQHNPFGASSVLVAFDNNEMVGVRAFMNWQWQQHSVVYKAVRAVDTATHPDYQGKGIFKKLTLQLVNDCQSKGVHFIFNTPNKNSMPGYLKMGWERRGKLNIHMQPVFNAAKQIATFDEQYAWNSNMSGLLISKTDQFDFLTTPYSPQYFEWRYGNNPNVRYNALCDGRSYLLVFRLKRHVWGTEFRICDVVTGHHSNLSELRKHIHQAVRDAGARLVTGCNLRDILWAPPLKLGPEITVRYLSAERGYLEFDNWKPSVGDMEVF